jgi:hypothetical protein
MSHFFLVAIFLWIGLGVAVNAEVPPAPKIPTTLRTEQEVIDDLVTRFQTIPADRLVPNDLAREYFDLAARYVQQARISPGKAKPLRIELSKLAVDIFLDHIVQKLRKENILEGDVEYSLENFGTNLVSFRLSGRNRPRFFVQFKIFCLGRDFHHHEIRLLAEPPINENLIPVEPPPQRPAKSA